MDRFFYNLECYLKNRVSRRGFIGLLLGGVTAFVTGNVLLKKAFAKSVTSLPRVKKGARGDHDLVLAEGNDPFANTVRAVEEMGGIERFVSRGDIVVIKPNMGWDRTPEQAANTNPMVVAALVELSYKAGARRVNVFEITCNEERRCYENSGIAKAAQEKGAFIYFADHWNVVNAKFPFKSQMENWPILRDAVKCDTFINVPVLKQHSLTGLTISMKNLMGVCSGTRGLIHVNIGNKLLDLTEFINPDLTVIDATRFLAKHGPSGGSLDDVVTLNKLIVATDPTLADSFAALMVKEDPMSIPNIKAAVKRNIGNADITKADIVKIKV